MPEFERRWLSAHVTTALDASTTSAETGTLHEVEFIAPCQMSGNAKGERTRLCGWVFLDEVGLQELGIKEKWNKWLGELQIGGERRYGFGHLRLSCNGWTTAQEMLPGYTVRLDDKRPCIIVERGKPILAHVPVGGMAGKGLIEPLVGRETDPSKSHVFGRRLTRGIMCWVPGTVLQNVTHFEITLGGSWRRVDF